MEHKMKRILFAILALITLITQPGSVLAQITPEQRAIIDSGVHYFDLEPSALCGPIVPTSNRSPVYVVGDSLTVGMRDSGGLEGKLSAQNWQVSGIQATTGISTSAAIAGIDTAAATGAGTFVVALGTNTENNFEQKVNDTIARLKALGQGGNPNIFWVNLYSQKNDYSGENEVLSRLSSSLGYTVIDWKGEVTGNSGSYPFAGDGIHHDGTGYNAKADFLVRSLGVSSIEEDGATVNSSGDNLSIIFSFFLGKKLTDFQAAGIMGNMHHESGYEPQRAQGIFDRLVPASNWSEAKGGGWGLVQWTPGSKMVDPVTAAGKDANDIHVQLEYLWGQLNNEWPAGWGGGPPSSGFNEKAAGDHLKSTTTVADATLSFETKYERHSGSPQPSRITESERILEMVRTGEIDSSLSGGSANPCGSKNSGNVVSTALEYAWPEHKGKGFVTPKPEYEAALKTARESGRYIGGNSMPGIDCGGFVTTVMIDSGFEPNYNHSGLLKNGAGYTVIQQQWTEANWQKIGSVESTADLKPGDVAFTPGHTFMYVGAQPGFETEIASASLESRAPMAGKESATRDHNGAAVEWYRKR